ncbi:MAG TPA: hypothetical protein PLM07_10325 [Candidatus Rifleibacterium sp.]|nr:hypothetical protein [Candidatus Rifleibacterium sp.]
MINLKTIAGVIFGLVLAFFTLVASPTQAADLNALVINFSPPIVSGQNLATELYQSILTSMREKPADLAAKVDAAGAVWSASQNLSGVQFALYFPDDGRAAIDICKTMLRTLAAKTSNLTPPPGTDSFTRHLHSLCKYPGSEPAPSYQPVSLFSTGLADDLTAALASETALLSHLYGHEQSAGDPTRSVVANALPTAYEIYAWETFSLGAFLSARYTGEIYLDEMSSVASASYEVIVSQYGLSLALLVSGNPDELFAASEKLRAFSKSFPSSIKPENWNSYVGRALQIIDDDTRDFGKKSLFDAWVKHWNGNFSSQVKPVEYQAPTIHSNGVSHPEPWNHEFSHSREVYPRFTTCSITENPDGADIAISFLAAAPVISGVCASIETDANSLFPLSLDLQSPTRLVISFHSPIEQISNNLARIRSRVTGYLHEKKLASSFMKEIQIGIAGSARMQPFELRGHLELGWPPVTDQHTWVQPDISSLSDAMMFASQDQSALKRRWQLATSTGKGKAVILSYLASRNLLMKNFVTF